MTDAEINTWKTNRGIDSSENPYSTATCSNKETIDATLAQKRLVITSENNYLKFDGEDKVNRDYNPSYTATIMNKILGASLPSHHVEATALRENQISFAHFYHKLFGVERIELYTQLEDAKPYPIYDATLTSGYYHTTLFVKSKFYDATVISIFGGVEFIGVMTAILLGQWWIYKIFYTYVLPYNFQNELDQIEKVYRIQES